MPTKPPKHARQPHTIRIRLTGWMWLKDKAKRMGYKSIANWAEGEARKGK